MVSGSGNPLAGRLVRLLEGHGKIKVFGPGDPQAGSPEQSEAGTTNRFALTDNHNISQIIYAMLNKARTTGPVALPASRFDEIGAGRVITAIISCKDCAFRSRFSSIGFPQRSGQNAK